MNRRTLYQYAAQTTLLDASASETFILRCRTSVQALRIEKVVPGQLYVFLLLQDAIGGHSFTWGDQIMNGTAINPAANGATVQCFIGMDGGVLRANAPGLWD